jgi:hypothetical protein
MPCLIHALVTGQVLMASYIVLWCAVIGTRAGPVHHIANTGLLLEVVTTC